MRWPSAAPSALIAALLALSAASVAQAAPITVAGDGLTEETWSRVDKGTWCVLASSMLPECSVGEAMCGSPAQLRTPCGRGAFASY